MFIFSIIWLSLVSSSELSLHFAVVTPLSLSLSLSLSLNHNPWAGCPDVWLPHTGWDSESCRTICCVYWADERPMGSNSRLSGSSTKVWVCVCVLERSKQLEKKKVGGFERESYLRLNLLRVRAVIASLRRHSLMVDVHQYKRFQLSKLTANSGQRLSKVEGYFIRSTRLCSLNKKQSSRHFNPQGNALVTDPSRPSPLSPSLSPSLFIPPPPPGQWVTLSIALTSRINHSRSHHRLNQ